MQEQQQQTKAFPSSLMITELEKALKTGWQILTIVEAIYPGIVNVPISVDTGAAEPDKVNHLQFFLPHPDHYHIYNVVLVRHDLDPKIDTLTQNTLAALKIMAMDEQASVPGVQGSC